MLEHRLSYSLIGKSVLQHLIGDFSPNRKPHRLLWLVAAALPLGLQVFNVAVGNTCNPRLEIDSMASKHIHANKTFIYVLRRRMATFNTFEQARHQLPMQTLPSH